MIQSGRSLLLARRKLGAALAGSWLGASLPITWQERHFSSAISPVASFEACAESAGASALRYGNDLFEAAAKKCTRSPASESLKWKVGMRRVSHGRRSNGPLRKPNSQVGCTRQPSPVRMGGAK